MFVLLLGPLPSFAAAQTLFAPRVPAVAGVALFTPGAVAELMRQGGRFERLPGNCWAMSALNATGDQHLSLSTVAAGSPEVFTEYRLTRPALVEDPGAAAVLSQSAFETETGLTLGMPEPVVRAVLGEPADQFGDDSGTEWLVYDPRQLGLQIPSEDGPGAASAIYGFYQGALVDITVGVGCQAP